eukprot:gene5642-9458_t
MLKLCLFFVFVSVILASPSQAVGGTNPSSFNCGGEKENLALQAVRPFKASKTNTLFVAPPVGSSKYTLGCLKKCGNSCFIKSFDTHLTETQITFLKTICSGTVGACKCDHVVNSLKGKYDYGRMYFKIKSAVPKCDPSIGESVLSEDEVEVYSLE